MPHHRHPSSYRDPSGHIFVHEGRVYRQVNEVYRPHYEKLLGSGLYTELVTEGLLLPHRELGNRVVAPGAWKVLEPEPLDFVSYPWEWCFAQLREAALLTLTLMRKALDKGLILKDATPLNIQWHRGRLLFIDTLSFETYDPAKPWIAYRQFCETFLAPLCLMHYAKQPLQPMLQGWPDGVPLPVAAALLPRRSRFNLHVQLHIHLHARVSQKAAGKPAQARTTTFSEAKLRQLLRSLEDLVQKLQLGFKGVWGDYYEEAAQRDDYLERKRTLLASWFTGLKGVRTALDAGANDGSFSRLLADRGIAVRCADSEHAAVSALYAQAKGNPLLTPLLIDFSAPSPAVGLNNTERPSFLERSRCDLVIALAFIHHLCIGRNIPFEDCVALFAGLAPRLVIEFVPREDPKVQYMLQQKADIYSWYTEEAFLAAFTRHFRVQRREPLAGSARVLFLMEAHDAH